MALAVLPRVVSLRPQTPHGHSALQLGEPSLVFPGIYSVGALS